MAEPVEINDKNDVIQELISCNSSLNMTILESEAYEITADTTLIDLHWCEHANRHLLNVTMFLTRPDVKITIENTRS